ncbi:hypothetical protein [Chromohalobacter sp. 48-RD10]|uniref:hypothetical protein n=1 Tax=Chromohalobacter sp. 48-RD10 TaxID=2994063 RepID=UPI002469A700|nr:hypothetical protein [Chromohalobacter sp. 48-RD10]
MQSEMGRVGGYGSTDRAALLVDKEVALETKYKILVINDKKNLNNRYRLELCDVLERKGCLVKSVGVFDSILTPFLVFIEILLLGRSGAVISSNIRSNIFLLIQPWVAGLVIINGMGRWRDKRFFRYFLLVLLKCNNNKKVVVQSYADFRYIRKYLGGSYNVCWVPGSGGTKKEFGVLDGLVTVQRDTKLPLVAASLKKLLAHIDVNEPFFVVGCKDKGVAAEIFKEHKGGVVEVGFVPQGDIFKHGNIFVQPSGYGEGFPHTLADAIVSGIRIFIDKGEYLKYGLWKLDCEARPLTGEWMEVTPGPQARMKVSLDGVLDEYMNAFFSVSRFSEENKETG